MRSAFALRINSGRIIFVFGIAERLRAFRYPIFTRGNVTVSGSCRAGFLRKHPRSGVPSPSSLRDATSPERGRFHSTYRQMAKSSSFGGAGCECSEQAERVRFQLNCKVCGFAKGSLFGRAGIEQREMTERVRTLAVLQKALPEMIRPPLPRSGTSFLRSKTSFLLAFYVN